MPEQAPASLEIPFWAWLVLGGIVLLSLFVDLAGHHGDRGLGRKHAILWSVFWIVLGLAFGGWVAVEFGRDAAADYLTAYLVEKSLSVDNLFVFFVVFSRMKIPEAEQHRVLQWGILGAFVTRGLFIAAGTAILAAWHELIYVLGVFLIYTGVKTAFFHADTGEGGKVLAFVRRHVPMTSRLHGHRFFAVEAGRYVATPLLAALVVIEISDVLFALDSIPAVFAVSKDPFIVYSSNVFAILGLRALYLVLADMLSNLKYLRYGLGGILVFAGAKILLSSFVHLPHLVSFLIIVGLLVATIIPSVVARRREARASSRII